MPQTIVDIHKLTKSFGSSVAVDHVSFDIQEGEIVGLLGPNGAGKTTTLAMILGITSPTSGTIRIFEKDMQTDREEILKHMNYSSTYVQAAYRLTVWEHVYVFALMYEVPNAKEKVAEMLSAFQLTESKDMLTSDLSSGNMARLNLAKAFINTPRLVLLDEPTSSLDPDIADRVRKFIASYRKANNTTMLITSHNMAEVEELCDRVIFMNHGKIIAEDTPMGLAKRLKNTNVRLMVGTGQKRVEAYCKLHKLPVSIENASVTIVVNEHKIAALLADLSKLNVDYTEISIDKPTLNDFFIGETRNE